MRKRTRATTSLFISFPQCMNFPSVSDFGPSASETVSGIPINPLLFSAVPKNQYTRACRERGFFLCSSSPHQALWFSNMLPKNSAQYYPCKGQTSNLDFGYFAFFEFKWNIHFYLCRLCIMPERHHISIESVCVWGGESCWK